jgi:hypothetical protein
MSEKKFHNNPEKRDESLYDLNLLGLWSQCGSDWSSTIKEEIQEGINQPLEQEDIDQLLEENRTNLPEK